MQIFSNSKKFFMAGLLLILFLACNSNSEKEKTPDKKQTDTITPPLTPKAVISSEVKKCFSNEGLKYKTMVTLLFYKKNGVDIVSGNVTSEEMGSGKTERGVFEGTIDGEKLMVKFIGNPPIVGDASEWTDKPWTLKKTGRKETLLIVFNAKNYETNQWEKTEYAFDPCK